MCRVVAVGADGALALPDREPHQPPPGVQRAPLPVPCRQGHHGLPAAGWQRRHLHRARQPLGPWRPVLPPGASRLVRAMFHCWIGQDQLYTDDHAHSTVIMLIVQLNLFTGLCCLASLEQ